MDIFNKSFFISFHNTDAGSSTKPLKKNSGKNESKKSCLKREITNFDIFCCLFVIIFLVCVYSSVSLFNYAYFWEKTCEQGTYDIHPYPEFIECRGNQNENCTGINGL